MVGGRLSVRPHFREVQKDLAQSSKRLIEHKIGDLGLGEADGFKVFRDVIQTPGDGLIIFKGMNDYNADSIKSLEGFKRGWWEEAHGATNGSIRLYRPTMRTSGSQMWWSWNPRHARDPVDATFRGAEIPTGAIVVNANWRDNPWWTAELEQERQETLRMNPDQYDHVWDGGYVKIVEGAYFARELSAATAEGRIGKVGPRPADDHPPIGGYRRHWRQGRQLRVLGSSVHRARGSRRRPL
ncbi:phage terminase large subunit [Caulobacter segnis]